MNKVYGKGFNIKGKYSVMESPNIKTKAYSVWKDMLRRGYSSSYKEKRPTYKDVFVCDDWLDFQIFAEWFYQNYKEGFQLDKDLIKRGNNVYCPKYCRFIPSDLNSLLVNRSGGSRNYNLPLGVCHHKPSGRFIAWCNNGEGKTVNLGYRDSEDAAFNLYKEYKESLIRFKAEKYYREQNIDEVLYKSLLSYKILPRED